jgi:hypothetical protein
MTPKSKIQKGKLLEKYIAGRLTDLGIDSRAERQIGSGSGLKKGDVSNNLGWCIEAKNTKNFEWSKTSKQVRREAMGYQKECIVWKPPRRPMGDSMAIILFEDFLELLKSQKENEGKEEILDKYVIMRQIDRAKYIINDIMKDNIPNEIKLKFSKLKETLKYIIKDL